MNQRLLLSVLTVLLAFTMRAENITQVIWTEGNFSCANFEPRVDVELTIPYTFYDKEDTYTVAGKESLFGSAWDAQDTRNDMAKNDETGLYELSWKNMVLTAGEYEYKVVANHSWEESYGHQDGSNCVVVIPETSIYNVTFTFDADTKAVGAIVENLNKEERDFMATFRTNLGWEKVFAYVWSMVDGEAVPMTAWPGIEITNTLDDGNYTFTYRNTAPVEMIIFNNGTDGNVEVSQTFAFVNGKRYELLTNTWTVTGSSETLFGSSWNVTDYHNDMTINETGLYTWTKNDVKLTSGEIIYKLVKNHSWSSGMYPDTSIDYEEYCYISIPEDGMYNVTIHFDVRARYAWAELTNSETLAVKACKAVVVVPSAIYDLGGRRIEPPAKGISIVRNADGSLRKVMR